MTNIFNIIPYKNSKKTIEDKFKQYSPSSNEITLYYQLEKYLPSAAQFTKINLDAYEKEFSSNVQKKNFDGYITVPKRSNLKTIKSKVSEKTGFPLDTMIKFGIWGGEEYDQKMKKWTMVQYYYVDENSLIANSHYNSSTVTDRYVYIFIDISKDKIFSSINDNQIKNDKKIEELKEEGQKSQNEISDLKRKMDKLNLENSRNRQSITNLTEENQTYRKKQKEEEERKKEQEVKRKNCNDEFTKDKNNIKNKKYEECKKEINKILIKNYQNEFEDEDGKKSRTAISLIEKTNNFTNEFIKFSDNYVESFKKNSKKIIDEYDTKKNQILIEHINFIVIGAAGVGKSSFINQSLLLENEKKAREGVGESVTDESHLYTSEKLTSVRMWDTQGIDYKINQQVILNEIKNLVNTGLQKGPDHFINIILYCINTTSNRFQEEEGKLIQKIMELYPSDNLPVIITQLQSYSMEDAKTLAIKIREILSKYLEENIVKKIEIKSVVSRKKIMNGIVFKAHGIQELLKCSFDKMGNAITSATSKKFSEEIENLCKKYVENKLNYINQTFKDELELLEVTKSLVKNDEDEEELFHNNNQNNVIKNISYNNAYRRSSNNHFIKNFVSILSTKFKKIYVDLNGSYNYNNDNEISVIFLYIEETMKKIFENLKILSSKLFEKIYKDKFQDYFHELQMKQSSLNKKFNTNNQINDAEEIDQEFKKELRDYFDNEFYKIYLCIIVKLFKGNLQKILEENFKNVIKANEKSINQKAKEALKSVTERLKEKLLKELDMYYPKEIPENNINPNSSNVSSGTYVDDFEFSF